jgi:hypothetical protein
MSFPLNAGFYYTQAPFKTGFTVLLRTSTTPLAGNVEKLKICPQISVRRMFSVTSRPTRFFSCRDFKIKEGPTLAPYPTSG